MVCKKSGLRHLQTSVVRFALKRAVRVPVSRSFEVESFRFFIVARLIEPVRQTKKKKICCRTLTPALRVCVPACLLACRTLVSRAQTSTPLRSHSSAPS